MALMLATSLHRVVEIFLCQAFSSSGSRWLPLPWSPLIAIIVPPPLIIIITTTHHHHHHHHSLSSSPATTPPLCPPCANRLFHDPLHHVAQLREHNAFQPEEQAPTQQPQPLRRGRRSPYPLRGRRSHDHDGARRYSRGTLPTGGWHHLAAASLLDGAVVAREARATAADCRLQTGYVCDGRNDRFTRSFFFFFVDR